MLERALALSRKAGYRGGEANALGNLAALRYARGHLAEVLELLDEAEILARELGQAHLGLEIAEQRGLVLYHLGHLDRARALLEDVRSRWMALGAPGGARVCLFALAEIAAHEGDFDAALAFVDEAAHVERQSGTEDEGFLFPGIRGAILVEAGRREEAIAPLERAVAADPDRELVARATLAALGREDPEAVEAVLRRLGDDLEIYAAMEAWLWLGRATGRAASTRRAHALLQELIAHAPPADRDGLADRLPLYREITAAWREVSGTSPTMGVGPEE